MSQEIHVTVAVLGGGPGGYTAAFRAADLLAKDKAVCLIEKTPFLGGVCLHTGCIPSKSLLHLAAIKKHVDLLQESGLSVKTEEWNLEALRAYQKKPIQQLAQGLSALEKNRKIEHIHGFAKISSPNTLTVSDDKGEILYVVHFEKLIIAAGSVPILLPFLPEDDRIVDSTGALELRQIPKRMLIIGGGVIGFEMSQIYTALGSKVTVVEAAPSALAMIDKDLVDPLLKSLAKEGIELWTGTAVKAVEAKENELVVQTSNSKNEIQSHSFDMILQCVGRRPNNKALGLDIFSIELDARGFIPVDPETLQVIGHPGLYAIGDCVGEPMLAHKAAAQGKVAASQACGGYDCFDFRCIPSVIYTDPEIAWTGMTEQQLKEQNIPYEKAVFPWQANGRALVTRSLPGQTKVLVDPMSQRIIGAGILGSHAGDLIGEMSLAIEMGAVVTDLALTIHPHPTFVETLGLACELAEGTITDLIAPSRPKSL